MGGIKRSRMCFLTLPKYSFLKLCSALIQGSFESCAVTLMASYIRSHDLCWHARLWSSLNLVQVVSNPHPITHPDSHLGMICSKQLPSSTSFSSSISQTQIYFQQPPNCPGGLSIYKNIKTFFWSAIESYRGCIRHEDMTRLLCRSCRDTPSKNSRLWGKKKVFEVAVEISLHTEQVCFNPPCPPTDSFHTAAGGFQRVSVFVSEPTHTHTHSSLCSHTHFGNRTILHTSVL